MKKRALVSVYKKDGILELCKYLEGAGYELVSTGGTAKYLSDNGLNVRKVEEVTGFPEVLGGRVKTLHPRVFSGILADKRNEEHVEQMKNVGLEFFDVVVVNLYPFEETISREGVTEQEAIEQIDIGGVSLIRAAAKNFNSVNVLTEVGQYEEYIEMHKKTGGKIPEEYSKRLAFEAFRNITGYDYAIEEYFGKSIGVPVFPGLKEIYPLRYGENPHQTAVLFKENFDNIFEVLHGKELSYNNLLDVDAAMSIIGEFEKSSPSCVIIKHGNPCGAAEGSSLKEAYIKAFQTDTVSPFGGIIIFNKRLDMEAAEEVDKIFSEIILAPDYDDDVLELLKKKKNRRIIKFSFGHLNYEFRRITGGVLMQERDMKVYDKEKLRIVTDAKPSERELQDCEFAYKIVKHTKSNAVIFVRNLQTLAIGGGQPSRVDSTKIAVSKAKQFGIELEGSVAASDAFFPFADGMIEVAKAGGKCIVQPGGSVRDEEVIKAANELGVAMLFTGYRHFRH